MMLSDLCKRVHGKLLGADVSIQAISTDTRTIKKGDVFLALRGESFDGHEFVKSAQDKGAAAVVVDNELALPLPQLVVKDTLTALGQAGALNRESSNSTVIAITGSSGKTSVKGMLQSILSGAGETLATEGNFNNHIGVPITLLRINEQHRYSVIEAGTGGKGEIAYLVDLIQPQVALVNNVSLAHGLGFGSEQAIAEEKSEIYKNADIGVVNLMDKHTNIFMERLVDKKIFAYSKVDESASHKDSAKKLNISQSALILASNLFCNTKGGYRFVLSYGEQSVPVELSVPGLHSVDNALAAAACAVATGLNLECVAKGLSGFSGVRGRMQTVASAAVAQLIDDTYNANPASMRAAIDFLASQATPVLVVGDMGELGEAEIQEHRKLGEYAKNKGIQQMFAVGPLSLHAVNAFGEGGKWFETQDAMKAFLARAKIEAASVLVKGSRYTHMENIIKYLQQLKGAEKC
ncbi:UDP-N-acetylmuramoyl-tripeptide--D-alanyl-D-alanine ligase [Alteromonadaceae bacterium Bs31]|nr:UDP-N-acetylmuramoyl-tripeptide--D-alanyl-D-alanine ligase [Alteromonadaceae bacterium Bs31]